jgi:hypothetical protein
VFGKSTRSSRTASACSGVQCWPARSARRTRARWTSSGTSRTWTFGMHAKYLHSIEGTPPMPRNTGQMSRPPCGAGHHKCSPGSQSAIASSQSNVRRDRITAASCCVSSWGNR